jgi:hypothetical protein
MHDMIAHQAQVLMILITPVWKAAKELHLLPYKIRRVEVVKEGSCEKIHFCSWFLQVVHYSILDPNYLLKKHCSHWVYQCSEQYCQVL